MACWPVTMIESLKAESKDGGVADYRSPGLPATAPGSPHSHMPQFPQDELVASEEDVKKFVEKRMADS